VKPLPADPQPARPVAPPPRSSASGPPGGTWLVGDVQGCDEALGRLLATIGFSPSRARLVVLGDLVNRGPASLAVLERLEAFGGAATCLLGNHDLHLLAVAHGARRQRRDDTFGDVLGSPRRAFWLDWLRTRRVAWHEPATHAPGGGVLCVHAGLLPQWAVADALARAAELEAALAAPDVGPFLHTMYGNEPADWDDALHGAARLRVIVNAFTRLRFCTPGGAMDFDTKEGAGAAPPGHLPWFDVPGRRSAGHTIAFGHWSTLGLVQRPDLLALDTGCVWGGALSAARIDGPRVEVVQVPCAQARRPG
jgi:bis(5'-nucleosyl)-tetraphosphatase (symmetrical)